MLGKSVLACYRGVGLVTEDAGPQVSKSTDHSQLPDIWKPATPLAASVWRAATSVTDLATRHKRPHKPQVVICATYVTDRYIRLWSIWY
jgi:hypothetical protein